MKKLQVGVLGCGTISKIYLKNLTGRFAARVEVAAVADVVAESARTRASEYAVGRACSPEELLADGRIELVLNLTPAPAHYEVSTGVLRAGKHLYSEKPLALSMEEGRRLVALAEERGLRLSVAPDTLLGAGVQTSRKVIEDGLIGEPVAAQGFVSIAARGERYLTVFRGPLLDLGPYHVGALVTLLGPVRSVVGFAQPKRQPAGEALSDAARTVDNPGNAAAVLEHEGGCLTTLIATAETTGYMPALKVYGTSGVLTVPDPNGFGGKVLLQRAGSSAAEEFPLTHDFADNSRGIGVADMAQAIEAGEPHRLSAALALHELEVMLSVIASQKSGARVALTTTCERAAAMPASQAAGV